MTILITGETGRQWGLCWAPGSCSELANSEFMNRPVGALEANTRYCLLIGALAAAAGERLNVLGRLAGH